MNPNDPNYDGSLSSACGKTGTCITGVPASYTPFQTPIDNNPATTNFGSNLVDVRLLSGKTVSATYDAGPTAANFARKRYFAGPMNLDVNASIFKVFPIHEQMNLRVNLDAFNVFNMPGENDPGANGIEAYTTNYQTARELQITARFTF